jgi:hypothetical protein
MAKTLSVTTAPPIRSAMPMPMTVTTGTAAFLSACRTEHAVLGEPLGTRAVRM